MVSIKIFDVDRGFCAVVNNGEHQIMIDYGYNTFSGFNPAGYLLESSACRLNYLIMSTFRENCLTSLCNIIGDSLNSCLSIDRLLINPSINEESLPELIIRNFGKRNALKLFNNLCEESGNVERTFHLEGVKLSFFWNSYPEFLDFDNLSLVTFISCKNINIIFPGNLKTKGWLTLLKNFRFRDQLAKVNLFVAAKQGQIEGYCSDVFNYCTPDLIIISNGNIDLFTVKKIISQYECHIQRVEKSPEQSRVLTTYKSGTIAIQKHSGDSIRVVTQRSHNYQLQHTKIN